MQEADISTKVSEIVSNVPDGQFVFIEDIAKGISNWSRDAVDYFGLPGINLTNTSEVIGNLVHPEDLERWKKEVDDAFAMKSDGFFLTYQIKNARGEYVHCTGKGKIILGDGGRPLIFAGSITVHQGEESNDAITDLPKFQSFLKMSARPKRKNMNVFWWHWKSGGLAVSTHYMVIISAARRYTRRPR